MGHLGSPSNRTSALHGICADKLGIAVLRWVCPFSCGAVCDILCNHQRQTCSTNLYHDDLFDLLLYRYVAIHHGARNLWGAALGTYRAHTKHFALSYRYLFSPLRLHPLSRGIKEHYDGLGAADLCECCFYHYFHTVFGLSDQTYKLS